MWPRVGARAPVSLSFYYLLNYLLYFLSFERDYLKTGKNTGAWIDLFFAALSPLNKAPWLSLRKDERKSYSGRSGRSCVTVHWLSERASTFGRASACQGRETVTGTHMKASLWVFSFYNSLRLISLACKLVSGICAFSCDFMTWSTNWECKGTDPATTWSTWQWVGKQAAVPGPGKHLLERACSPGSLSVGNGSLAWALRSNKKRGWRKLNFWTEYLVYVTLYV